MIIYLQAKIKIAISRQHIHRQPTTPHTNPHSFKPTSSIKNAPEYQIYRQSHLMRRVSLD